MKKTLTFYFLFTLFFSLNGFSSNNSNIKEATSDLKEAYKAYIKRLGIEPYEKVYDSDKLVTTKAHKSLMPLKFRRKCQRLFLKNFSCSGIIKIKENWFDDMIVEFKENCGEEFIRTHLSLTVPEYFSQCSSGHGPYGFWQYTCDGTSKKWDGIDITLTQTSCIEINIIGNKNLWKYVDYSSSTESNLEANKNKTVTLNSGKVVINWLPEK